MIVSSMLAAASSGGFWAPIARPLADVLAFFYSLVPNYGVAIVLLTVAMMVVLTPLTIKQTRSMLVMQKLQPEMKKLQEQYKNDRQGMNEAMMALYKEHNASPLGGCLPMLLPIPLFFALYRVLEGLSHLAPKSAAKGAPLVPMPKYLSTHTRMFMDIVHDGGKLPAFGMNLAKSARNVGGGFGHSLPYFILALAMIGTQFYQQYQMTSKNPMMKQQPGQAMMMKVFPLVFGFFALTFPAGVIVYWVVSNSIRIGQVWALYRYDPKVKALIAQAPKDIEAKSKDVGVQKSKDSGPAKTKNTGPAKGKEAGRPSLRELMKNASEAANDRRQATMGKGDTKPGSPASKDRSSSKPGAGSAEPAKQRRPAPPGTLRGAGGQNGGANGGSKGSPSKAPPSKATTAQSTTNGTGKGTPSGATPAKGAVAKATPGRNGPNGGSTAPKAAGGRGPVRQPTKPPVTKTPSEGNGVKPSNGNGSSSGTTATPGSTGADPAEVGRDATPDGVTPKVGGPDTNGTPARGRTGAGNARSVSSHRRRKGR